LTREGIIGVLSILKTAYPNHFGKISKQDAENTINLWASMFAQEDGRMVSYAVKQLIATNVFPPTIAEACGVLAEVVRRLGWMDLCRSENVIADRAHFIKLFEGKQSKAREMAMIPLEVKEGLSQMPKNKALPQIGGDEAK